MNDNAKNTIESFARISCIIPTHNRSEFLLETIHSVLNQSHQPDEILIINNGNTSVDLPDEIMKEVKVFTTVPNQGASFARNFGASVASGEYFAFLDDDDLWGVDYLKEVSTAIEMGGECIISRLDWMKEGVVDEYMNDGDKLTIQNILMYNPGITGSNVVIEKKVFYHVGGYDVSLSSAEDKALVIEVLQDNTNITYLKKSQAIMRIHDGERLTNSKNMIKGLRCFTHKYKDLMNMETYLHIRQKIFRHKYSLGSYWCIIPEYSLELVFRIFFKKK